MLSLESCWSYDLKGGSMRSIGSGKARNRCQACVICHHSIYATNPRDLRTGLSISTEVPFYH